MPCGTCTRMLAQCEKTWKLACSNFKKQTENIERVSQEIEIAHAALKARRTKATRRAYNAARKEYETATGGILESDDENENTMQLVEMHYARAGLMYDQCTHTH